MKRILNFITVFFLILIVPCAFLIAAKNGLFKVRKIEVVEVSSADEDGAKSPIAYESYFIRLKLKLSKFDGENLWNLDPEKIKEIAKQESWVENVEIYRRFPQTLRLEVKAKPSVAIFMNSQGELHLISTDGTVLPKIEETKSPKLPVIQDSYLLKNEKAKSRIIKILNEMPSTGSLSLETVAEINMGKKDEIWLTHLQTKSTIKLGNENIAIKSARVAKVLEYLEHNNLKGRVIDADFSKKVLVKLRNDR